MALSQGGQINPATTTTARQGGTAIMGATSQIQAETPKDPAAAGPAPARPVFRDYASI